MSNSLAKHLNKKRSIRLNQSRGRFHSKNNLSSIHLDKSLDELDFKLLSESQIEVIKSVYKTFLAQNLLKSKYKNKQNLHLFKVRRQPRKRRATLVTSENSSTSTQNSLGDFNDSLNLIQSKSAKNLSVSETSSELIKDLDRFSSIIIETKMNDENRRISRKKKNISEDELNTLYLTNIEPIQTQMVPKWESIDLLEKNGIIDLLERWQDSLAINYSRSKKLKIPELNHELILGNDKLISKGPFDFEKNLLNLKKIQLELFDMCTIKTSTGSKIQPNTRLILRSFQQFINAFSYLLQAKNELINSESRSVYWKLMSKNLCCISRATFRCLFYVHENANLYKASIGAPPIFFLESDEIDNNQIPSIKLESLIEYACLCLNRQNINIKQQDKNSKPELNHDSKLTLVDNSSFKLKKYKLILNCLIRLIQVSCLIRDDITLKQIRFDTNSCLSNVVDVDIYCHFISNNINLIREYLIEILRH